MHLAGVTSHDLHRNPDHHDNYHGTIYADSDSDKHGLRHHRHINCDRDQLRARNIDSHRTHNGLRDPDAYHLTHGRSTGDVPQRPRPDFYPASSVREVEAPGGALTTMGPRSRSSDGAQDDSLDTEF